MPTHIMETGNTGIGTHVEDKIIFTQDDGNEFIDSLDDGYLDLSATTSIRFNNSAANTDVVLDFVGTTNSGQLKWMEDEDYFQFMDAIRVPTYERHIQISAKASGTVANQATDNTVGTAVGLQFSSALDKYAGCQWEIPDDWDGTDAYIEIDWLPDSGAMSGTDTVEWVLEYRSIAEGELVTQGTIATVTVTNDDDNAQYKTIHSRFTLDFDHADQPMTKQDHMYFLFHRNTGVANDFAGTVTATAYEIIYNSTGLPTSN